jgi:soluble lytic murein transglycosylase-like protein
MHSRILETAWEGLHMSISPASSEQLRWPAPVARRPWPLEAIDGPDQPSSPAQDGSPDTAAPSSKPNDASSPVSFTKLIAQLSRQLTSIEQTFTRALQALTKSVESTAASNIASNAPADSNGAAALGPSPYDGLIRRAANRNDLDPALLSAVVRQESGFDPNARSSTGAMGLMQLMPDTARSLGVKNAFDPAQNVEGGAKMLRGLIDRYSGRLDLALAAYNAGSGAVDKYHGVPPYAETRDYVHSILADYRARALGA